MGFGNLDINDGFWNYFGNLEWNFEIFNVIWHCMWIPNIEIVLNVVFRGSNYCVQLICGSKGLGYILISIRTWVCKVTMWFWDVEIDGIELKCDLQC